MSPSVERECIDRVYSLLTFNLGKEKDYELVSVGLFYHGTFSYDFRNDSDR